VHDSWRSAENARAYGDFSRRFPMYTATSRSLVARLGLTPDHRVLDLACGTGITTEAVLEQLGPAGRVVAVDGSAQMLDVARQHVGDDRVSWVESELEQLGAAVDGHFDSAVCNSAIWQSQMDVVVPAVAWLLRPGARLAFNIGSQFILGGGPPPPREKPSLIELMSATLLDHDFVPPRVGRPGGPLTVERVEHLVTGAGLVVEETSWEEHEVSVEQERAWLSIPIFTELPFAGLTYEQRMDALGKAYSRLDPSQPPTRSRWAVFVVRKP
jgi:SAM-dependent methyltransferase